MDLSNLILHEEEAIYVKAYNDALLMQERFLQQKATIKWLRVGDSNSAYFHKVVKGRISRSQIDGVTSADGTLCEGDQVAAAFVSHYSSFLSQKGVTQTLNIDNLFISKLDSDIANDMVKTVTPLEEFFTNGTLLKELNHTLIALIPKVSSPSRINDYRPISCCNVLFKNYHNYHLDRGPPGCAFKIDIQKAYDTVDWDFLREILVGFGFHHRMIAWIMECVSSTSFSLSINGVLHGFFKGKRDLRQGDPLSPYLFTLLMEIYSCLLMGMLILPPVIMECLDEFKGVSGLIPSLPKSTAYFCNVLNHTKLAILNILPFDEGRLPVKYLGVPLISSRLIYRDCRELIEKVKSRINDWKNKSLSADGRLQLIRSVIGSMHIFWASVFILPTLILIDIEQLMHGFLWCQGDMHKGKSKMAWEVVCLPKREGGRGIRRLDVFNKALMVSHVWGLLTLRESLWVWNHIKVFAGLPRISSSLDDIVDSIIPISKRRSARGIIAKLVFNASAYFIWQERNGRLFKNQKRSPNQSVVALSKIFASSSILASSSSSCNVVASSMIFAS
ncbi:hypothetical protein Tco_0941562 [Tanacetum coccineum]|uniref:Reverse transcriptase domain-containing protein n=1 Tax=Tanacetum coccineum TaxID=301880 RepID=A0ABQ5DRD1_9ASTR